MLTMIFGSNWFIDTNGIVTFSDPAKKIRKDLFRIELRGDGQPMVTVEVRDAQNHLLGKAYRSTSFVTVNAVYETSTEQSGADVKRMVLQNRETKEKVFELINHGTEKKQIQGKEIINYIVEINGIFHIEGCPFPIIATKQYLDINTNKLIGNKKFGGGFGIELTPNTFAL
jgi:hypothetical protein